MIYILASVEQIMYLRLAPCVENTTVYMLNYEIYVQEKTWH